MKIVPARLTHVGPLANNMRQGDRDECRALGRTPKDALRMGLRTSIHALAALDEEGKPVAMFGLTVVSALGGVARPWFLGTDEVFTNRRELLGIGRRTIAWWSGEFRLLENIVSTENTKAIRLLRSWGAEIGTAEQVYRGVAFVPFTIQAKPVTA